MDQNPYPFRDEFARRIQAIIEQLKINYEELVNIRFQLDKLRRQDVQLRQEFNAQQNRAWKNATLSNASDVAAMSNLRMAELESRLQESEALITTQTQSYNRLSQDIYKSIQSLFSTINDCIRVEN